MATCRRLPPLPTPRDILRLYGIRAQKKLSQNFILDPRTLDKLARSAGPLLGKTVLEVGPGPGGITRAILGQGARLVHVIEKDPRFLTSLQLLQEAAGNRITIQIGDILRANLARTFEEELRVPWDHPNPPDIRQISNLPFSVTTPFLLGNIRDMEKRQNIYAYGRVPSVITVQKEVAERMVSSPGERERSRLSVMCQNFAQIRLKYFLKGGGFVPKANVDVAVITLLPLRKPYIELPFGFLERVFTTVFHGKQKHIRTTVGNLFPGKNRVEKAEELLNMCRLPFDRTAISLDLNDFEKIAYHFRELCDKDARLAKYVFPEIKEQLLEYQMEHDLYHDHNSLFGGEEGNIVQDDAEDARTI
eukprot:maker-scaffold712_size108441-snap-gene-0.36 protein:Tk06088 transcript:maker-scaffold712_size108441-snap-gene-0.36-mRNA-1 annotation:"mitochondrial transcription factor b1"